MRALGLFLAALVPLAVGIIKNYSWPWVFFTSAILTGAMILPTLFWFKDPPLPPNTKPLGRILKDMVMVLADAAVTTEVRTQFAPGFTWLLQTMLDATCGASGLFLSSRLR